jgi:alpha-beta hydrolase superfamily lysophospholipase
MPDAEPKAALVFTHGQGDWSDRYRHVALALSAAGYAMYASDLRGHGKSGGARGHTPSYEILLDDLQLIYDWAREENPKKTLFLYGHSMGGQITLSFALRRKPQVAGVIATGPWLRLAFEPPAFLVALGGLMNRLWPTFSQSNRVDLSLLSHDMPFIDALHDPAQYHNQITAREYFQMSAGAEYLLQHASEFDLPVLLMHGGADKIISPAGTQAFYAHARSADKTLKVYDGLYHEITNERERERVIEDMRTWLDKHVSP